MCSFRIRGEKISSHAHKTGSWYLFGVLKFPTNNNNNKLYLLDHKFKQCRNSFYNEHPPILFIWGVQLFVTCGCCRKLPQEVSNNLQHNNVGRQVARKCCPHLVFRKWVFLFSTKSNGHWSFSFTCTYCVVGMSHSAALNRVKLLTVDHKDILGIESCVCCVCCYNCTVNHARRGSSRRR